MNTPNVCLRLFISFFPLKSNYCKCGGFKILKLYCVRSFTHAHDPHIIFFIFEYYRQLKRLNIDHLNENTFINWMRARKPLWRCYFNVFFMCLVVLGKWLLLLSIEIVLKKSRFLGCKQQHTTIFKLHGREENVLNMTFQFQDISMSPIFMCSFILKIYFKV